MLFEVTHTTEYSYGNPAAEAYVEARLTPPNTDSQEVREHRVIVDPEVRISTYTDYFLNEVSFFSLPFRHKKLVITNKALVSTRHVTLPRASLETSVQEARQIFSSALPDIFDFLQQTDVVSTGREAAQWARRYLPSGATLEKALTSLNQAVFTEFVYKPGATDHFTGLPVVWKNKRGVCQDFAHVMLSVLRTAGMPCRYVCGYIETDPPPPTDDKPTRRLVGAVATHAWIEVLVPGMHWVALDPTNNQWCGERHVAVSYGRDAHDATPLRGTFKGTEGSKMKISVQMKRRSTRSLAQKSLKNEEHPADPTAALE